MSPTEQLYNISSKFANLILSNLPQGITAEDLQVNDQGLVLAKQQNSAALRVIGCQSCFMGIRGTDQNGYPTINGVPLLRAETIYPMPAVITADMRARLWICPNCKMLQSGYTPYKNTAAG